jgi:hypothetical protein
MPNKWKALYRMPPVSGLKLAGAFYDAFSPRRTALFPFTIFLNSLQVRVGRCIILHDSLRENLKLVTGIDGI